MAQFKCKCGAEKIIAFCKIRPVCESCGGQMKLVDKNGTTMSAGRIMTKADVEIFNWSRNKQ